MRCPGCSATVEAVQNFCKDCGHRLKNLKCRHCDSPLSLKDKFCGECGNSVKVQSVVVPPPTERFLFIPVPSPESEEESSESYRTWLENKFYPELKAKNITYKSPDDFDLGNPIKQQWQFQELCTLMVVPVCPAVCSNLSLLSCHFTQAKPPIILLLPKDIACGMTSTSVCLQSYTSYSCKTDTDTSKTVTKISKFINNTADISKHRKLNDLGSTEASKIQAETSANIETRPISERFSPVFTHDRFTTSKNEELAHANIVRRPISGRSTPVFTHDRSSVGRPISGRSVFRHDSDRSTNSMRNQLASTEDTDSLFTSENSGSAPPIPSSSQTVPAEPERNTSSTCSVFSESTLKHEEIGLLDNLSADGMSTSLNDEEQNGAPSQYSSVPTESASYPTRKTGEAGSLLERPKAEPGSGIQETEYYESTASSTETADTHLLAAKEIRQGSKTNGRAKEPMGQSFLLIAKHNKVYVSEEADISPSLGQFKSYSELVDSIYNGEASHIKAVLGDVTEQTIIRYPLIKIYNDWKPQNLVCLGLIARYSKNDVRICALTYLSKGLMKIRRYDKSYISEMKLLQKTVAPSCSEIDRAWGYDIKENAVMLILTVFRVLAMVLLVHGISQKDLAHLDSLAENLENCSDIVDKWRKRLLITDSHVEFSAEEQYLTSMKETVASLRTLPPSKRETFVELNLKLENFTKANKKGLDFLRSLQAPVKVALMFTVCAFLSARISFEMFDLLDTLYSMVQKDKTFHWADTVILLKCIVHQAEQMRHHEHITRLQSILIDVINRCAEALKRKYRNHEHQSEEVIRSITKPLFFHCSPDLRDKTVSTVFRFVKKTQNFTDIEIASMEKHSKHCIEEDLMSFGVHVKEKIKEVKYGTDEKHTVFSGTFGYYKEGVEIHCRFPRTRSECVNSHSQHNSALERLVDILQKLPTTSDMVNMLAYRCPGNGLSYYMLHVGPKYQSLPSYVKDKVLKEHFKPLCPALKKTFALSMISAVKYCNDRGILMRNLTLGSFITCREHDRRIVKLYNFEKAETDASGLLSKDMDDTGITRDKDEDLPLLWLAPESIFTGKYNRKSEVFSLALALMELYSDGVHPYQEMGSTSAKEKILTILKYKMLPERRPGVIEEMYIILLMCLLPDPKKRLSTDGLHTYVQNLRNPEPNIIRKSMDNVKRITKELLDTQGQPEMGIPETLHDIHSWEDMWTQKDTGDCRFDYENFLAGHITHSVNESETICHDRPQKMFERGQYWLCVVKRNFRQEEINLLKSICSDQEENKNLAKIHQICKADHRFCSTEQHIGMKLSLQGYETLLDFALENQLSAVEKLNIYTSICRGMRYLHENHLVHCSLQAKYIYVKRSDGMIHLRIGQLNRATLLYMNSCDNNITQAVAKPFDELPQDILRWCPLETHEMGLMSMYSDVAQFGCTIWEVENCSGKDSTFPKKKLVPFAYLPIEKVPEALKQRHTLPKPDGCEDWVHKLIKICTSNPRCGRPLSDEILEILAERNPSEHPTLNLQKRKTYVPTEQETKVIKRPKPANGRTARAKSLSMALQEDCEKVEFRRQIQSIDSISYAMPATNIKKGKIKGTKIWKMFKQPKDRKKEQEEDIETEVCDTSFDEKGSSINIYDNVSLPNSPPSISQETGPEDLAMKLRRAVLTREEELYAVNNQPKSVGIKQNPTMEVETVHLLRKNFTLQKTASCYAPTGNEMSLRHSNQVDIHSMGTYTDYESIPEN